MRGGGQNTRNPQDDPIRENRTLGFWGGRTLVFRAAAACACLLFLVNCGGRVTREELFAATRLVYRSASGESLASGEPTTMRQLANGLTFIHKRNSANQIVGLSVIVMTGSTNETTEENGLTNLSLRVMRKATETRTAQEIEEEIDALGASIDESAETDFSTWSLVATVEDFEPAFDLLSDILLRPSFPAEEIENERAQVLAAIRLKEDNKFAYTYENFRRLLYAGHPYARPVEGTPETVSQLSRDQMVALHQSRMLPSNMIVSVVGNLDEETALRAVQERLGLPCALPERRVVVGKEFVPRPAEEELRRQAEQGYVCLGFTTCPVSSPDYPALRIASAVLGEGMSARLFSILRDEQGLAYAVGSLNKGRRQQGHLVAFIGTKPGTIDESRRGIEAQIERLKTEPVEESELQRAKNYASGRYLMAHETNASQAHYLAYWQAMGMGLDFDAAYPETLERVTARDILRVANKYFLEPTVVILRPEPLGAAAAQDGSPTGDGK